MLQSQRSAHYVKDTSMASWETLGLIQDKNLGKQNIRSLGNTIQMQNKIEP